MMEAVRGWLLTLISASLVCALAQALMPPGPVRQVGRLVCGLVLMAAILSPLPGLDLEGGRRWLDSYLAGLELREEELSQEVNGQLKQVIEGEYAAYIVDKAAQLGEVCAARVECRAEMEGVYLPVRAEIAGTITESGREQLCRLIQEDLGIPREAQLYTEEGSP